MSASAPAPGDAAGEQEQRPEAGSPEQLAALIGERLALPLSEHTDVARLLHGRGGAWPGFDDLIVDRYGGTLRIGIHGERTSAWVTRLRTALEDRLQHCSSGSPALDGIWLQWRGRADARAGARSGADLDVLLGTPRAELDVFEQGLRYRVHPGRHRNAGLFLDAAPARTWLRAAAQDLHVLNLFAYTCSFSVAALAGGARSVVNLDMASGALDIGRRNHQLNDLHGASFLSHELFRSWGALRRRGPFDLVVLDPPSFQRGSFEADRHWPKLLGRLEGLLSDAGRVLVCLNSPFHGLEHLDGWRRDHAPGLVVQQTLPRSLQFPEVDAERGLKVQIWQRSDAATGRAS